MFSFTEAGFRRILQQQCKPQKCIINQRNCGFLKKKKKKVKLPNVYTAWNNKPLFGQRLCKGLALQTTGKRDGGRKTEGQKQRQKRGTE